MSRNVALYVALRLARVVLPSLPLPVAYRLADITGRCAYLLLARPRTGILSNLAVVTGEATTSPAVRALAQTAFATDARNWVDTLRIEDMSEQAILDAVEIEGWEHVPAALAQGRGLVLLVLHLGNVDLVGQVVVARGFGLTIPVERMEPPCLFDMLLAQRRSKGINAVPVDRAPREMLAGLRRGEIVAVAGDRGDGRRTTVDLFGHPASLPSGAVALARRTGAPLLVGAAVREGDGRFRAFVSAPVPIQSGGRPDEDDRENAQRVAVLLEEAIRRAPGQWLAFTPIWPEGAANSAATMRHTSGAAL